MNANQIKSMFSGYQNKYGELEAVEKFLEKYPETEGDINLILSGEDEIDESLKYQADPDFLPEVEDEVEEVKAETVVETVEVKEEKPVKAKKEKVVKEKAVKEKVISKAQLAYQMYESADDKTRKTITKRFVDEIGLTIAGANTYYSNVLAKFRKAQNTQAVTE